MAHQLDGLLVQKFWGASAQQFVWVLVYGFRSWYPSLHRRGPWRPAKTGQSPKTCLWSTRANALRVKALFRVKVPFFGSRIQELYKKKNAKVNIRRIDKNHLTQGSQNIPLSIHSCKTNHHAIRIADDNSIWREIRITLLTVKSKLQEQNEAHTHKRHYYPSLEDLISKNPASDNCFQCRFHNMMRLKMGMTNLGTKSYLMQDHNSTNCSRYSDPYFWGVLSKLQANVFANVKLSSWLAVR